METESEKKEKKFLDILKELGPKELETIERVVLNIRQYDKFYATASNYIFSKYPDIDIDKLEKISEDIDESLADLGRAEVLLIYNKLNEPFAMNFFKTIGATKLGILRDPLKDINTLLLALSPDIRMKNVEKTIKDIEEKVNNLSLTHGEKWLLYNYMGHIYLLDMIEVMGM